jgi:hypothetical protein
MNKTIGDEAVILISFDNYCRVKYEIIHYLPGPEGEDGNDNRNYN